jgi:ribose transport system permease protein
VKKLLGITVFLFLVYGALLFSQPRAITVETHVKLFERIGLYGILSLAAGMLIVTGGIDLSIGSLVCLCCTVFGMCVVKYQQPVAVAFLASFALAGVVGLTNGLLVTKLRLQPFMVTLCGLFIFRSLARWLNGDTNIEGLDNKLQDLAVFFNGTQLGVPVYWWILSCLVVVASIFLHLSVHGRYFYALGSNERAARFAGVSVDAHKILAYVLCSLLTALYSFLYLMKTPSVEPSSTGQNDELMAIAGAVLGGCTLRGGEGTVYGMVVGTMIIQILLMMNSFWRVSPALEGTMIGTILLLGVILDELLRRRDAYGQKIG